MKKSLLTLLVGLSLTACAWPVRGQSSGSEPPCETELRETQLAVDDLHQELELVYTQLDDSTRAHQLYRETVPDLIAQAESRAQRKGRARGRCEGASVGAGFTVGLAIGARFGPLGAVVGGLGGAAGGGVVAALLGKRR